MKHKKNPHRGSRLRQLLDEDGVLEKVEVTALKRAVALQFTKAVKEAALTKQEIARRMNTSRAAVDRLLDPSNSSATLSTLEKAARVLGRRIKIELVPA
jgi:antitoxin HicB